MFVSDGMRTSIWAGTDFAPAYHGPGPGTRGRCRLGGGQSRIRDLDLPVKVDATATKAAATMTEMIQRSQSIPLVAATPNAFAMNQPTITPAIPQRIGTRMPVLSRLPGATHFPSKPMMAPEMIRTTISTLVYSLSLP